MSLSQIRRPRISAASDVDDSACSILHVDMDAFYASVSLLDRPDLRGQPVIVGGSSSRGVVLSATYEARALGIHSAMPMARARRLAPRATVVEPNFRRYQEVSESVMSLFRSISPIVEPLSLDEAFLDVSGSRRRLGSSGQIARTIRARVNDEQGVTCSVGVASTKLIAKLASTLSKPDGMRIVPPDQVIAFLHPLPVAALWGVGERTDETLRRLGLRTVSDIAATPVETLRLVLGHAAAVNLADLVWGRDPRRVRSRLPDRSMGAEETFSSDVDDPEHVIRELLRLSEKVASRMRGRGYVGRTVHLKVRFADFSTITRSRTLPDATDTGRDVYTVARKLFSGLGLQRARLRLVGVRVSGLTEVADTPRQLTLGDTGPDWRDVERAVDRIEDRFGRGSVCPASLVDRREPGMPPSQGNNRRR
ncbi:MAG: DNA polymerase IV [Candidatus Nanopelagicales bacterium]|nr:DNA polymerase IV [Candidatus Nanopelagicales bacterium]MDZ4249384.1 DNA polymerase IV [Candidatus Nanopelagicales bacterium]MDZ7577908.1 DNA polymerase IV [Candidatus Nanopelagicales bacterium]